MTALLLIDVQKNMLSPGNPVHDAAGLLDRLTALRERARAAGVPVVYVRNCGGAGDPDVPGTDGWQLHDRLSPDGTEPVFDKTTCDTFASTTLGAELTARGVTHIVVTGLQSDWCVRETTLGALERGWTVTLVSDGHATYDGRERTAAEISAAVNAEFAERVRLVAAADVRLR